MRMRKKTITLEDYEYFLQNSYCESFSLDQLNTIIHMHGFKKIHKRRKNELYEALSNIDLLEPQRSTLKDKFSPHYSSLTLEQVKQDLEALDWQECPLQSVQALNLTDENDCCKKSKSNVGDGVLKEFAMTSFKISRRRRRSKERGKRSIVNDGGGGVYGNIAVSDDVDGVGCDGGVQCESSSSMFADTYSWEF